MSFDADGPRRIAMLEYEVRQLRAQIEREEQTTATEGWMTGR